MGWRCPICFLVDDRLVFCEASQDQMVHLCWLLMWFGACSG